MDARKGPPRHHGVAVTDDALDSHVKIRDVTTESFRVGHQSSSADWTPEGLIGLVHHVRVRQVLYQVQLTFSDNSLEIDPHQRFGIEFLSAHNFVQLPGPFSY